MPETFQYWVVNAADWIFGWVLFLPRDLALCSVAILMALFFAFGRKWTTDQEWLHRTVSDKRRQKQLIREARARGDAEAVLRHQSVIKRIEQTARRRFMGRAFLGALLPLALLVTWGLMRLAYIPPRTSESVEVRATIPDAAPGELAHLAPEPGLAALDGWIQRVVEKQPVAPSGLWDKAGAWLVRHACALFHRAHATPPRENVVIWHVLANDTEPHLLQVRYAGRTYQLPFVAGRRQYEQPRRVFENAPVQSIEVALKPRRLLGVIGGLDGLMVPPWLLVCLVLVLPLVRFLRTIFSIV